MSALSELGVTVDPRDVEVGWRPLTGHESNSVPPLAERAAGMLLTESEGLLDRLALGTVHASAVKQVLIQAVQRVLRNPEGWSKGSFRIDDYSESWEWSGDEDLGLYFTTKELATLSGQAPPRRGRAFTINTMPKS